MDSSLIRELLNIKLSAGSYASKLQGIEQIREALEPGDSSVARKRVHLGVQIEYATEACELVIDSAEQLLRGPPSYSQHPDDYRHRLIELKLLVSQSDVFFQLMKDMVDGLHKKMVHALESRVEEIRDRMIYVLADNARMQEESSEGLENRYKHRTSEYFQDQRCDGGNAEIGQPLDG